MSNYKLTYFNWRGRGEVSRMIFIKAGVKFQDNRIELEDWPALKEKMNIPFDQLPVLEVDGKILSQSFCIEKFLGKRFGMYGNDEFEEALIGSIVLNMEDFVKLPFDITFEGFNDEDKDKFSAEFRKRLPRYLTLLERQLASNPSDSGYFVGNTMTVADIRFVAFVPIAYFVEGAEINWDDYPKLKALITKMESDPQLGEKFKERSAFKS